jgi:hypothetical protein
MQIDFDGFQAMVDQLDGVEVCLPEAAKEKDSGIDLPAGRSVIQGEQALAFVRQRKGLPNGDIDRIRRQQQFIGAIVRKVLSAGTLLNPVKLNGVVTVATQALQVDEDLSIGQLQEAAFPSAASTPAASSSRPCPIADVNGFRSASRSCCSTRQRRRAVRRVRRDVPPAPGRRAPPPSPEERSSWRPQHPGEVLNGAGVSGLGRGGRRPRGRRLPGRRAPEPRTAQGDRRPARPTAPTRPAPGRALPGARPELDRTRPAPRGRRRSSYAGAAVRHGSAGEEPSPRAPAGRDPRSRPVRGTLSELSALDGGLAGERDPRSRC